ncbi:hypothetical protein JNUCC23_09515 [Peribacillus sp. JNUCC 23]
MQLAQNLIDTFKVVTNDDEIWRLLYYTNDPLNPSKTEVRDLPNFDDQIKKDRIMRSPKTSDLTYENGICRICMYFGNRGKTRSAPYFSTQDIVFDIYAHIDSYDMYDARSLLISDRLSKILHNKNITGFSKLQSDRMMIIGNAPNGYIGYKWIYEFISGNL